MNTEYTLGMELSKFRWNELPIVERLCAIPSDYIRNKVLETLREKPNLEPMTDTRTR